MALGSLLLQLATPQPCPQQGVKLGNFKALSHPGRPVFLWFSCPVCLGAAHLGVLPQPGSEQRCLLRAGAAASRGGAKHPSPASFIAASFRPWFPEDVSPKASPKPQRRDSDLGECDSRACARGPVGIPRRRCG